MSGAEAFGVICSPHPDDAVLSAWSTLRSRRTRVVNVCTGAPPAGTLSDFDRLFGVNDSAQIVELRLEEDAVALAHAGCNDATGLGFLDAQYRTAPIPFDELRHALNDATEHAAWISAPAGIGAHPDHVAVRDAARAIAAERGIPFELYADLPYAVRFGWPSWVTGFPPRPYLVPDALWDADLNGVAGALEGEAIALTPDERAAKAEALECYATQYWALNAGPLDRIRDPEVVGYEVRWRVTFG
jgi:LmbE family N-acetylglucosaminyl deacetylase